MRTKKLAPLQMPVMTDAMSIASNGSIQSKYMIAKRLVEPRYDTIAIGRIAKSPLNASNSFVSLDIVFLLDFNAASFAAEGSFYERIHVLVVAEIVIDADAQNSRTIFATCNSELYWIRTK